MAKSAEDEKKVLIKYNFSDNYTPVYCNGAWGGITPQGEMCLHFYLERLPLPHTELYNAGPAGLGAPIAKTPPDEEVDGVALRQIVTGITMSEATTRAIVVLLQQKLTELDTLRKAAGQSQEIH